MSISFWLKKGVDSSNAYVFSRSTSQWLIFQNATNNSLKYRLITSGGTYTKTGGAILDSQWHHCAFVWDSSANTFDIYEDGVKIGTSTNTSGSLISSTASAYIFSFVNGAPYSSGKVDELAIFDSALSQSDVSAIYNNGEPQSLDAYSPLIWFRMGDNATWNGATWTMTSVGTDTRIARSINMVEANRTTDVPTASSFTNTKSILLDGVDDFCETASTYSELDGDNKLTISFWAKSTSAVTSVPIHIAEGSNRQIYVAIFNTGRITFKKNINADNTGLRADSGTPHDGNWNHIMICMDLTASTKGEIFFNGNNITHSRTLDTNVIQASSGDFYINEENKDFTGNIDEVALWSGTDLRSDVATIYNSGVANDLNNNGLTAPTTWYRMGDGDTAPTIQDTNGSANLTMQNFSTFSTDVPT